MIALSTGIRFPGDVVKLLERIGSIDFSQTEKDRIGAKLLDPEGLAAQVLREKAPHIRDTDFWRRAQKAFRVTGFRDGRPEAIQAVLARVRDSLRNHPGSAHSCEPQMWWLYERSAMLYLQEEKGPLYSLLKREDLVSGTGSDTDQILRSILKYLPMYETSVDDVKDLYEIWGFERSNNADEILSSAWVEAGAVRRMVSDGISTIRRELSSTVESTKSDTQQQTQRQSEEIASVRSLLQLTRNELTEVSARITAEVATAAARMPHRDPASRTRKSDSSPEPAQGQISTRVNDAVAEVQHRVEALGRQIKELRVRLDHLESSDKVPDASVTTLAGRQKPTTVLQVLEAWKPALVAAGVPATSIDIEWILLEIIRRARVIVTDEPELLASLARALSGAQMRRCVASPLWLSDADWKDDLAFISQGASAPRLLFIHEFDVALQESYLVPPLLKWMLDLSPACSHRVVVVPSNSDASTISTRVMELASLMTSDALHIKEISRYRVRAPQSAQHSSNTLLSYTTSTNRGPEDQVHKLLGNRDVEVPRRVAQSFVSLYDGLRSLMDFGDAMYVAQEATLLPWIERARGELTASKVRDVLERRSSSDSV